MRGLGRYKRALVDAALVAAGCAVVSLIFNALRQNGIPLIRFEEYELLVPCPETIGDTAPIRFSTSLLEDKSTLLVDARSKESFDKDSLRGAVNIPYDYLEETPAQDIKRIAGSSVNRVVVIGDGLVPDSGEELAKELSGRGIRNVFFIEGGIRSVESAKIAPGDAQ